MFVCTGASRTSETLHLHFSLISNILFEPSELEEVFIRQTGVSSSHHAAISPWSSQESRSQGVTHVVCLSLFKIIDGDMTCSVRSCVRSPRLYAPEVHSG